MSPEDITSVRKLVRTLKMWLYIAVPTLLAASAAQIALSATNKADIENIKDTALSHTDYSSLFVAFAKHQATLDAYIEANDEDKAEIKAALIGARKELNEHLKYHINALTGTYRGTQPNYAPLFSETVVTE